MRKMIQRSIAAFMLATLGWLSVPAALGSPALRAMHSVHRNASAAQNHSCCPRPAGRVTRVLLVAGSFPAMPCGPQHPCCARQRPGSPSNMPVEAKVVRPAAERVVADVADGPSAGRSRPVQTSVICFLPPPFEQSTVLRI